MSESVTVSKAYVVSAEEWERGFGYVTSPKFVAVDLYRAVSHLAEYIEQNIGQFVLDIDVRDLTVRTATGENGYVITATYTHEVDTDENELAIREWKTEIIQYDADFVSLIQVQ